MSAPDPHARAAASSLGRVLDADLRARAASAWARLFERSVTIEPASPPPHDAPTSPGGLPCAFAGLELADGRLARLDVDAHLLAGRLDVLAGGPGEAVGPLPLSPAEEGLFAYLVLAWLALLPAPRPRLAWIHGGAPPWAVPGVVGGAVAWRIELDGEVGGARWWLPPDPPALPTAPPRPDLPVRLRVLGGQVALAALPEPGDLIPVFGRAGLWARSSLAGALTRRGPHWIVDPHALEVPMSPTLETLPVRLDVLLAQLDLTVGQLAALTPGQVVPLPAEDHPMVSLVVGDRPVALGVLVQADGRLAVQITQVSPG